MKSVHEELYKFDIKLMKAGLSPAGTGDISTRHEDKFLMYSTGSQPNNIHKKQFIEHSVQEPYPQRKWYNWRVAIHQFIYIQTTAQAIIHSHPPYATALSILIDDHIEPVDFEGREILGEIPIVEGVIDSEEVMKGISRALQNHKCCMARGNGVFIVGANLREAYDTTCMAEHSSKIKYLTSKSWWNFSP